MFVRNAWYVGAWADEIADKPLGRRICNEPVVFFRDGEGKVGALVDRCCHRSAPLSAGCSVEAGIECGYHGQVFDRSGQCVKIPGQDKIPPKARVRSYPVVERDQLIWIWMGEAEKADEGAIIPYPYHQDRAKWPHKHGMLPIGSNAMLMIDNLMDLTHIGYLHRKNIGGAPGPIVQAKAQVTPNDHGLRFTRWVFDTVPPPTYVRAVGFKGQIDRWQDFEFIAPGAIVQWSGAMDVAAKAFENQDQEGGFATRLFHFLTPETEGSCFYFWSVANGYRQNEPEATTQLFDEIYTAFLDDKAMVELQQSRIDELGEEGLVDVQADAARIHMRRVVNRLMAEEREKAAAE